MCTILILNDIRQDFPLVIAANRDEFFARPTSPPQVFSGQEESIIAGIDQQAGGSWMGATESGFVVGITNTRGIHPPDASLRSRGTIVWDALHHGNLQHTLTALAKPQESNPFQLLFGRPKALYVAYASHPKKAPVIEKVPPGFHVLPNGRLNSPTVFKTGYAHQCIQPYLESPWEQLQSHLETTLTDSRMAPDPDPVPEWLTGWGTVLSALFVQSANYGTRSSTIITATDNQLSTYRSINWLAEQPAWKPYYPSSALRNKS